LWNERYDRKFTDLFKLKEDIILKVANELLVGLITGESYRPIVGYKDDLEPFETNNLAAWETYWLARESHNRYNKIDNARARELYKKAFQLDPHWYLPLLGIGWTHRSDARNGWSESRKKSFEQAVEVAHRVLAIHDKSASAYQLLGDIHLMKREYDEAESYFKKALSLNPNALIHAGQGFALNYLGKPQEAIVHFKIAMRYSPIYPFWYDSHLGLSYHLTGQYEKAIDALKKAIERGPDSVWFPHVRLAAVYSDLGREEEARAQAEEVLRIKPDFSVENYAKANPFKDSAIVEHRKELLRKAGLK